jgi:hypothetical protein
MLRQIVRCYFWDGFCRDIKKYIRSCTLYQKTKARHHLSYGELIVLSILERFWQKISIDFIIGLPHFKTFNGKICDVALMVVYRFTKYILYIPTTERFIADGLTILFLQYIFR